MKITPIRIEQTKTGYSAYYSVNKILVVTTGKSLPKTLTNLAEATVLALDERKGKKLDRLKK